MSADELLAGWHAAKANEPLDFGQSQDWIEGWMSWVLQDETESLNWIAQLRRGLLPTSTPES